MLRKLSGIIPKSNSSHDDDENAFDRIQIKKEKSTSVKIERSTSELVFPKEIWSCIFEYNNYIDLIKLKQVDVTFYKEVKVIQSQRYINIIKAVGEVKINIFNNPKEKIEEIGVMNIPKITEIGDDEDQLPGFGNVDNQPQNKHYIYGKFNRLILLGPNSKESDKPNFVENPDFAFTPVWIKKNKDKLREIDETIRSQYYATSPHEFKRDYKCKAYRRLSNLESDIIDCGINYLKHYK